MNKSHPTMLITGASRGIGAATAVLAAQRGYDVVVNYRENADSAHQVVEKVQSAGRRAIAVRGDVAQEEDILNLFETTDGEFGPLDVLVNNAGILGLQTTVARMEAARIQSVLNVNVTGSILCAREAVRRMSTARGGKGGAIVNLSSAAARLGSPNEYVDYAASKGAIDSFTLGLAREVASEGIRVNAVAPGLIETDIHASGGMPDRVARRQSGVPMGRGGSAEEVAQCILWLAGQEASYVTATVVDVSGGR